MRQSQPYRLLVVCTAGALGLAVAGCASPRPRPLTLGAIGGGPNPSATASQPSYDDSPWQSLLLGHVGPGWTSADQASGDDKVPPYPSLVDYKAIQAQPVDLNAYMTDLAANGPTTTPQAFLTQAHQLAYYINAYNACAVRAVLAEYPVATMYAPSLPAFEYDWYFQVDGKRVNLHDLREAVRQAADGDVRVIFALCCGAIGSAPLASKAFGAASLYDDLNAHMRDCLAMPQIVKVSHEQQQLQLWWRIIRYRQDFVSYYQKLYGAPPETLLNVMMELSPPAQRQTLNKAVGYKIVEIPFDRRLNDLAVRASVPATMSVESLAGR